ncbi:MAG TPA: aminotransferase class I/II-fold pyridoxal phosphate-dependent enzyme [Longimicrobium sp.]|nr:aminotransferase class I/II-fold pyridoxal phosphate-dependent enzyme [Longimicrobium sp.]
MKIPPFLIERFFARYEFSAPFLLCASDIEGLKQRELLAWADAETRALWEDLKLGYTETLGHPLLRAEIASLYQGVRLEEVVVANPEELIFLFANAVLGPGDHAVAVWPAYQSLYEVARSTGAEVSLLRLSHDTGWRLDLDALRQAVRPNTRAIIINFPHNPTGALITRAEQDELIRIARARGAYLFSDEVYRLLEHDPADRLPPAVERYEKAVSLGAMSKAFAMGGLRIGWVATRDAAVFDRMVELKDYTSICAPAPSELLALMALRAKDRVLERNGAIVRANLARVDRFFADFTDRFEWVRPKAGSTGFPRLRSGQAIEDFAKELVDREGVMLLPGSVYEYPGNHFRLGLGRLNLPEAVDRLERFVRAKG